MTIYSGDDPYGRGERPEEKANHNDGRSGSSLYTCANTQVKYEGDG